MTTDADHSEPPAAGADVSKAGAGWRRLSPRAMIVRPVLDLIRLLPVLAGLVILHSGAGSNLLWGVAATVLAIVTGPVHWVTTRYMITDDRVYLRRGLISQRVLSVARDRVRSVDVTAHPLHRVLGVCRVSIGTGRNDLREGESFHLDGLAKSDAESIRMLLLDRVAVLDQAPGLDQAAATDQAAADYAAGAAGPAAATDQAAASPATASPAAGASSHLTEPARAGSAAAPGPERELVRLRLGWLRYAPLTMTGLAVLGVLVGFVLQLGESTNINLASTGPARLIVSDLSSLPLAQRIATGAVAGLIAYVLVAAGGYIAVFWKFRLVRQGADALRVTRGLLSTRATTIALSRLRGVEISEPLLLRVARGARCIAITTGLHIGRGAERGGSVLLPPAPRAVACDLASEVLGVAADLCAADLERHGSAARRRRYIRALAGAAGVVGATGLVTLTGAGPAWIWVGSLALLPAAAALAADRYRNLGHRLTEGWLITRMGSLVRRRSIIKTDAIIGWRIHQTWFQRRRGLVTITATTAAGRQHYPVQDVPVAQALAVAAAVTGDLVKPFLIAEAD